MTMLPCLHDEFKSFRFIFEAIDENPKSISHKTLPNFSTVYAVFLPSSRYITMTSHDGRYPLPDPALLALRAAIGNILNASTRGEKIERLLDSLEDGPLRLA